MILIFSQRSDYATSQVCMWLQAMKKKFVRLNMEDDYLFTYISSEKIIVERNKKQYNLLSCDSYWYRRDGIAPKHFNYKKTELSKVKLSHIRKEYQTLKEYVYMTIEEKIGESRTIGSYFTHSVNKLHVLDLASHVGLNVPFTYVVCRKDEIMMSEPTITKPIYEGFYEIDNHHFLYSYTNDLNDLAPIPPTFMASCLQTRLEKEYELRIFFLKGMYYPYAIFSQQDADTAVDSRKGKVLRYVPYKLPNSIKLKLEKLMALLHLNTGSIDMVVTPKGEYIFLEVNPVGQFIAYGQLCNSYLDRLVAEKL